MLSTSFFLCFIVAGVFASFGSGDAQTAALGSVEEFGQTRTASDKNYVHPPVCKQGKLLKVVAMAVYPYREEFKFTQTERQKIKFDVEGAAEICPIADAFRADDHFDGRHSGSLPNYLVYFLAEDKQRFTTAIVVSRYILWEKDWSKLYALSDDAVNILKGRVHSPQPSKR